MYPRHPLLKVCKGMQDTDGIAIAFAGGGWYILSPTGGLLPV